MAAKSKKATAESSESRRHTSPEVTKNSDVSSSSESDASSDSDNDNVASETQGKKSNLSFQAPQPYKAPSGFKSVKRQSAPSSSTSSVLSDLRGKQVYHITAPAFLPLSNVEEMSLGKVMQGEPIIKHEGVQYGIPAESISQGDMGGKTLLLYDSKSQQYYTTETSDIRSYHIQELINLPERSGDHDVALEAGKEMIKPPRKQPKHLKMRFRPLGSGYGPPETLGSSSEESEGEQPTFKVPSKEKDDKKRKHHQTEAEGIQPAGVPRKKTKKDGADDKAEKSKKSSKGKEEKKRKKADKAA
ncbi:hypothetical protein BBP40_007986 [Aspergillus hancockii]|nr:hypothetical protein BBP40_007986 [Aspergillus hancockii]